ncbi:hypothetical protein DID75_01170 [Candidatus Marinamargulisbacteria bacterium SCGC AG-410-N11]|nr:hypothetical protein DID75_01170 [Candidatus Marinamargulisbacteria bacterium SCGC AG-410-N11]
MKAFFLSITFLTLFYHSILGVIPNQFPYFQKINLQKQTSPNNQLIGVKIPSTMHTHLNSSFSNLRIFNSKYKEIPFSIISKNNKNYDLPNNIFQSTAIPINFTAISESTKSHIIIPPTTQPIDSLKISSIVNLEKHFLGISESSFNSWLTLPASSYSFIKKDKHYLLTLLSSKNKKLKLHFGTSSPSISKIDAMTKDYLLILSPKNSSLINIYYGGDTKITPTYKLNVSSPNNKIAITTLHPRQKNPHYSHSFLNKKSAKKRFLNSIIFLFIGLLGLYFLHLFRIEK